MSLTSNGRRARLERIIEDSIGEAQALEQALHVERQALEKRDDAALAIAAEDKRRLVARLEGLDAARKAVGDGAHTAEPGASGTNPLTEEWLPAGHWQTFLSVVGECKRLNTTNGAIIRLRRQQINDALRVMSGTSSATYGPSGAESASGPRRALAAI